MVTENIEGMPDSAFVVGCGFLIAYVCTGFGLTLTQPIYLLSRLTVLDSKGLLLIFHCILNAVDSVYSMFTE